jgi:hypothetical protein
MDASSASNGRTSFPTKENYCPAEPIKSATPSGKTLFLLMVDDMSRYMWLILLSAKSDAAGMIKQVQAQAEAESGKKLRVLCTDRGGEFTSTFTDYYNEIGIR